MKHTVEEFTLDNGVKGLLIDVPGATVMDYELNFRAGHYLVKRNKWEVPHIMEHLVLGANNKFPQARLFQAEFEKNGAYSNATTSTYSVNYIAECADFEWKRILDLLKISVEEPLFLENEFIAEKGNVREELTGDLNNHFRQLIISAREKMGFVGLLETEKLKLLDGIKLKDISDHYKKTHHSDNMRFIISGAVKKRQKSIIGALESINLPRGERYELPDETPIPQKDVNYIHWEGVENLFFYFETFSHLIMEPVQEDAMVLLNVMLTNTLHSKILGEARARGLVYHMSSNFNNFKLGSGWWFGAQIMESNAPALFEIMVREIKNVLDGKIDDADIESARQYCLGRYQRGIQTVNGLVRGYGGGYFFDERIDDYYAIPARYKEVNKNQMIDVARQMFSENVWGLHILGTAGEKVAQDLNSRLVPLFN